MARRRKADRRNITPDSKYKSHQISRLINRVMVNGKKTTAERIVYSALDTVEQEVRRPAVEVFEQALRNTMPAIEVRSRRVGGATYQVPVEVKTERSQTLALRWLLEASRKRKNKSCQAKCRMLRNTWPLCPKIGAKPLRLFVRLF